MIAVSLPAVARSSLTPHLVLDGLRYRVVLASGEVCSSLGPAGARVCCRCGPHVHEGLGEACEVRHHRHHFVDIDESISANTVIIDGSSKNVLTPFSERTQVYRSNLWPRDSMPCPWYVRQVTRLYMPNLELRKVDVGSSRPKKCHAALSIMPANRVWCPGSGFEAAHRI